MIYIVVCLDVTNAKPTNTFFYQYLKFYELP